MVLNWGSSCPLNSPKGLGALDHHAQARGSLGRTLAQRVCGAAHIWAGAVWPYPKPLGPGFPGGIQTLRNPGNPEGRSRTEGGLRPPADRSSPRPLPGPAPPWLPLLRPPPTQASPLPLSPPLSPLPGHPSAVPAWWRPREPRVSAPGGHAGKRGHAWPGHHSRRGGGADWAAAPRCAQPSPRAWRRQHERGLGAPGGGAPRSGARAPRLQGGAAAQLPAPAGPRPAHQVRPQRGAAAAVPEPVGAGRGGGGRGPCRC